MEGVNMVNAPAIARDRNIHVREIRSDQAGAFQTLMTLTVTSETQTRSIAGTLFNEEPRVVRIKGIPIDAKLGPNMLYLTNEDKPGIIGGVGTILGDAGVNIATFSLGRAGPGGDAISLIEIDGDPTADLIEKIKAVPHVIQVSPMRF
jgi:D-3-phosphoglycerate dehydrogenase